MANAAVIFVALTTVTFETETPEPLTTSVAPAAKLEPLRVTGTLVACDPLLGVIELRTGAGGGTVIVTVADPAAEGDAALAA
jgi:hypothetical protein